MAKHRVLVRKVPLPVSCLRGLTELYANNPETDVVTIIWRTYDVNDCTAPFNKPLNLPNYERKAANDSDESDVVAAVPDTVCAVEEPSEVNPTEKVKL